MLPLLLLVLAFVPMIVEARRSAANARAPRRSLPGAQERCESCLKPETGNTLLDPYGKLALVGTVQPGNPEKLGD